MRSYFKLHGINLIQFEKVLKEMIARKEEVSSKMDGISYLMKKIRLMFIKLGLFCIITLSS